MEAGHLDKNWQYQKANKSQPGMVSNQNEFSGMNQSIWSDSYFLVLSLMFVFIYSWVSQRRVWEDLVWTGLGFKVWTYWVWGWDQGNDLGVWSMAESMVMDAFSPRWCWEGIRELHGRICRHALPGFPAWGSPLTGCQIPIQRRGIGRLQFLERTRHSLPPAGNPA